jgi:teichuronic acid biosynthesis glycosyltransferase TuaH
VSPRRVLVYCAGVGWDDVQGTDKHLALQLARRIPVLWVDPPLSIVAPFRGRTLRSTLAAPRMRRVAPGVVRLVTLAPPYPARRGVAIATDAMARLAIRHAVRRLDMVVAAMLVSCPDPRFGALPAARHIYFATDDFVAGAELMGVSRNRLIAAERRQVAGADVLIAITPEVLDRWGSDERPRMTLPNGCDPDAYMSVDDADLPVDVTLGGPIAGVVGQLSARLDLDLLEAVADAGISLLLVGPLQKGFAPARVAALLARNNVQWVGPKPFAALPSYLRVIDVGLTPYADTAFNRASFPLKTLEYLAAGRGAVSTPLPAVERLASPWISIAGGPAEFVAATSALLNDGRSADVIAGRRAFAREHSWATRADQLLRAALGNVTGGKTPGITPAES